MVRSAYVTPQNNNSKISSPYYKPVEDPYYRLMKNPYYSAPVENSYYIPRKLTQNLSDPANSNNMININLPLEHLLAIAAIFIVLFTKGENLNIKDFINKNSLDIGKILNVLGIFKTEESNSSMSPIMNVLSKITTKGGQPIVSDKNINPSTLADIIKQAIEIANELKKDSHIVDTIKNTKEKVDADAIENIANKIKSSDEHKNIDPSNLKDIIEQAVVIANKLKEDNMQ